MFQFVRLELDVLLMVEAVVLVVNLDYLDFFLKNMLVMV